MASLNSSTPLRAMNTRSGGSALAATIDQIISSQEKNTVSNGHAGKTGTESVGTGTVEGVPPSIQPVPSSGSKTGFTTIVNVTASEEYLQDKTTHNDDEEVFEKGEEPGASAFKDHSYTLRDSLSVRGRPLRRSKACGECDGCVRPNCNKCRFCLDKPKNGGPNRLKKRCVHRVCTKMVPSTTITGRRKSGLMSASSAGEEDEFEDTNGTDQPSSSQEEPEHMETDKHTAIVTVDDTSATSPLRPRRAKVIPKKFQADYAVPYNVGKKSNKYLSPSSNITSRSLKKSKSEVTIRNLRRRHGLRQNDMSYIDTLPNSGKFSTLRKQLKIDMAAPGTTLSAKRRLSHSTPKSIHIRRSTPQEDTPASGKLSPVPQPVLSSWVTQSSAGSTGSVIVVARTKENSRIVSAATGLSMLANGASERPKLPHSPVVAKLQALDLPGDPLSWGFEDVQKYLADAGFREVAAQLREEEVDGEALMDLTPVWLTQCLRIKLGPAIKVCKCIEELRVKIEAGKVKF